MLRESMTCFIYHQIFLVKADPKLIPFLFSTSDQLFPKWWQCGNILMPRLDAKIFDPIKRLVLARKYTVVENDWVEASVRSIWIQDLLAITEEEKDVLGGHVVAIFVLAKLQSDHKRRILAGHPPIGDFPRDIKHCSRTRHKQCICAFKRTWLCEVPIQLLHLTTSGVEATKWQIRDPPQNPAIHLMNPKTSWNLALMLKFRNPWSINSSLTKGFKSFEMLTIFLPDLACFQKSGTRMKEATLDIMIHILEASRISYDTGSSGSDTSGSSGDSSNGEDDDDDNDSSID
ncbi:hypothetical protein C8J56DRAFT_883270 [Mycena floridula]|nr:hypothetical protein C8J56DRAFT_883270 [Mycena floridula]